jgi:hypothetical protein
MLTGFSSYKPSLLNDLEFRRLATPVRLYMMYKAMLDRNTLPPPSFSEAQKLHLGVPFIHLSAGGDTAVLLQVSSPFPSVVTLTPSMQLAGYPEV